MKPIINDITTSFEDPPEFVEIKKLNPKRDYAYPREFIKKQMNYYSIDPLKLQLSLDESFNLVKKVAQRQPRWRIIGADKNRQSIEVVVTSKFFRFKDDVVIEIRQGKEDQVEIHMRSKSRLGKGDLGVNYLRIIKFFHQIQFSGSRHEHSKQPERER
jgi:uncharacterized protein (DUF1499 family)